MHVHRSQRTQGSRRALNSPAAAGATRASRIYKRFSSLFGRWTRANKSSAAGPRQPPEGWHAPALWEGPKESQRVSKPAWWNQTRATGSEDHRPVPAWAVAPTAVSAARPTLPLNESFCKGATTHQKAARLAEARGFQPEGVGTVGELGRVLDRQGLIIYTHLRRTSGTMLEDCYIKPAIAHLIRRPAWAPMGATWNCIEGGEGRFGAPSATVFQRMAIEEKMRYTLFAYRHCPMGLHAFTSRPYTYITMLRAPAQRMISWALYCTKTEHPCGFFNTKTKRKFDLYCIREGGLTNCTSDVQQLRHAGVSPPTAFYTARDVALATRFLRLPAVALADQFLPPRLEILLDDNYAVRMLCGGAVHEQEAAIGLAELRCAQRSLANHYSFVGILEEQAETVCQLTHSLGLRPGPYAPTPRAVHRYQIPKDFELAHARKYIMDNELYEDALNRFSDQRKQYPECVPSSESAPASSRL